MITSALIKSGVPLSDDAKEVVRNWVSSGLGRDGELNQERLEAQILETADRSETDLRVVITVNPCSVMDISFGRTSIDRVDAQYLSLYPTAINNPVLSGNPITRYSINERTNRYKLLKYAGLQPMDLFLSNIDHSDARCIVERLLKNHVLLYDLNYARIASIPSKEIDQIDAAHEFMKNASKLDKMIGRDERLNYTAAEKMYMTLRNAAFTYKLDEHGSFDHEELISMFWTITDCADIWTVLSDNDSSMDMSIVVGNPERLDMFIPEMVRLIHSTLVSFPCNSQLTNWAGISKQMLAPEHIDRLILDSGEFNWYIAYAGCLSRPVIELVKADVNIQTINPFDAIDDWSAMYTKLIYGMLAETDIKPYESVKQEGNNENN